MFRFKLLNTALVINQHHIISNSTRMCTVLREADISPAMCRYCPSYALFGSSFRKDSVQLRVLSPFHKYVMLNCIKHGACLFFVSSTDPSWFRVLFFRVVKKQYFHVMGKYCLISLVLSHPVPFIPLHKLLVWSWRRTRSSLLPGTKKHFFLIRCVFCVCLVRLRCLVVQ